MTKSIIKQNVKRHLALVSADQVKDVCRPLQTHFGVKSLVYKSIRDDGKESIITTHPDWIDYFFEHGLYKGSVLEKEPSNYVRGELLWSHIKTHNEILQATREGFDIDNGITLIRPYENGCEFYYFGASRDDYKARQLLSNNVDLLDKFTHYLKSQLEEVVDKVHALPLQIQDKFKQNETSVNDIPCYQNQAMRSAFINDLYKNGVDFNFEGKKIRLTKHEYKIAIELMKGKTMRDISDEFFISLRTVESHLDNIKLKFNVRKKSDLLVLLSAYL